MLNEVFVAKPLPIGDVDSVNIASSNPPTAPGLPAGQTLHGGVAYAASGNKMKRKQSTMIVESYIYANLT
eukprot:m.343431 g.343431  ORF g.343431 m.343431 type:complete len:70 (-) comp22812_c0_seq1:2-211(-)